MSFNFKTEKDLIKFIQAELISTSDAMHILGCSRQNIFDLIRRGKLTPVKELQKDRLFLKKDILARLKPSE